MHRWKGLERPPLPPRVSRPENTETTEAAAGLITAVLLEREPRDAGELTVSASLPAGKSPEQQNGGNWNSQVLCLWSQAPGGGLNTMGGGRESSNTIPDETVTAEGEGWEEKRRVSGSTRRGCTPSPVQRRGSRSLRWEHFQVLDRDPPYPKPTHTHIPPCPHGKSERSCRKA